MSYLEKNVIKETAKGLCCINIGDCLLDERNVYLNEEVNAGSALSLLQQFMYLERRNPDEKINFFINSPGGSVPDGMLVYDYIRMMKAPVRTICTGKACSMGAVLFLAGTERLMFSHSELMIHDASFGNANFNGLKPDEIEEKTKELVDTCNMLRKVVAERTGKSIEEVTEKMKKDSFFKASEAIGFGLATGVVDSAAELMIEVEKIA